MHPQVFEINLDQESTRFIAGQVVTGKVVIILQKEKLVKGVTIRLIGQGAVSWEAGISSIKYSHNLYSDSEVYVDTKTSLFSREDGREQLLIAGRHEYRFSIQLPTNIPSSLEVQYGSIRYRLEASIVRSWKDAHTTLLPIEIRAPIDLIAEPKAREPVKIYKEKIVGLMLCQTGPLTTSVTLSKAGFAPGDYLQFGIEIKNLTSVKMSAVIVTLRQVVIYKCSNEKKSQAEKIIQCVGPSVEMKGGILIWQNNFQIPDLPPSPLKNCKLMELQYYIEIKMALERWSDLKICTPIVIGSYGAPEIKITSDDTSSSQLTVRQEESQDIHNTHNSYGKCDPHGNTNQNNQPEPMPLIQVEENPIFTLDWGSSACLAEIEKITSRPVPTVPSFLLSASENLYAMSMGSCDKLSTNYEILDDRHVLFEDEEAFVDICTAQLQNLLLRQENASHNYYG